MRNIKSAIAEYLSVVDLQTLQELPEREVRYVDVPVHRETLARLEPFKVTPIPMGLPPFVKFDDLLDELEGPCRR